MDSYLLPTPSIDCDHPDVKGKADELVKDISEDIEKAKRLFMFIRDNVKYNPYTPRSAADHFRASVTLARKEGFCIQKAIALAALSRASGIPSRLGFAIIRNHQIPDKLAHMLTTNEIPDHGYAELFLNGKWVKATPAFDITMCEKNGIIPVEFDGINDAVFHSHTRDGRLHIEYVSYRGYYDDAPFAEIVEWTAAALTVEARRLMFLP